MGPMNFDFSDDQQAIKRTANDLLAARFKAEQVRELAEAGEYDDDAWKEICELGWPGIFVSEEHGGQGLGTVELVILMEELGYALAPLPFLSNAAAGLVLQHAASDEQQRALARGLASGEARGTVGIVRNGEAPLVPDARVGRRDRPHRGRRHGLGRARRPPPDVEPLDTIDATRRFARVRADGGEPLAGLTARAMDRIAVAVAAELVGVAQRTMEMAVDYARERKQFGRPIGAYQAVSHQCAEMLLEAEGARSTTYWAAWCADSEPETLPLAASMAKAYASDAGWTRHGVGAPGARRHRLHLGARPALLPQARQGRRPALRHRARAPRASRRADRSGARSRYRLSAAISGASTPCFSCCGAGVVRGSGRGGSATTCVTWQPPVSFSTRWGRSTCSHFEAPVGSVETTTSS